MKISKSRTRILAQRRRNRGLQFVGTYRGTPFYTYSPPVADVAPGGDAQGSPKRTAPAARSNPEPESR